MKELKFTVPLNATSSSKNSRQLTHTQGGGMRSLPSSRAQTGRQRIKGYALQAIDPESGAGVVFRAEPMFGSSDDIAVNITHRVADGSVDVEVCSCGPKPEGKTGRGQDIDNLASTILDALQGVAFGNDRQVSFLQVKRV